MNYNRYKKKNDIILSERKWPSKVIEEAPIWCSVDLRDGNQALMEPMVVEEKIEFFKMLVGLGFKQIEAGFPSASQIEFDFIRRLAEQKLIPDDVTIQIISQCREHLIDRTFESMSGLKNVIFHIYNNTSSFQREKVYGVTGNELKEMAVRCALKVKEFAKTFDGNITLEYSPESFTETDPKYSLEVCNAVIEAWEPDAEHKMIVNFPETIENDTPNVFADRIEWISNHLSRRDSLMLSIHPHNDRGTAVAASELAMMAGAVRIEGTLFGNGERAGNVDLLTLACNFLARGIDPQLNLARLPEVKKTFERLTKITVHERQPYTGELVFTAFSGGHQDAINKALKTIDRDSLWQVPYLPIDPADIGRRYEPLVRINSQSGKGGIAFIMENYHGFKLPKSMHKEFYDIIQTISENEGEIDQDRIMEEFKKNYIDMKEPYHFRRCRTEDVQTGNSDIFHTVAEVTFTDHGVERSYTANGNGPIDAVKTGLQRELGRQLRILDYSEHALREGSNAQAAAYIHLMDSVSGKITYGVGVSSSTTRASIRAIFSALNRMEQN